MPAFAFLRSQEQVPWFVRSLGSLRLTKREAPMGGMIPMARLVRNSGTLPRTA